MPHTTVILKFGDTPNVNTKLIPSFKPNLGTI